MSKRAIIIPILVLGVAAVLLFSIKGYWTTWEGGGEQRTDDAYVRADMTPMSTRVSGTVKKVAVEDFETVTPGQPLVELDDADYKAMLAEAEELSLEHRHHWPTIKRRSAFRMLRSRTPTQWSNKLPLQTAPLIGAVSPGMVEARRKFVEKMAPRSRHGIVQHPRLRAAVGGHHIV